MKILYVIPSLSANLGGPVSALLNLVPALREAGCDIDIFTTGEAPGKRDPVKALEVKGARVYCFPIQHPKFLRFSLPLAVQLKKAIPSYDIVHIYSLFQFPTQAACYYCRCNRKPYVMEPVGQLDPVLLKNHYLRKQICLNMFDFRNLRKAALIRFTSLMEQSWVKGPDFNQHSVVLPLGLNIPEFQKEVLSENRLRNKYPVLKNKKIILFLGRISFKKGLDILTMAFSLLAQRNKDAYLVIAGPDDEGYARRIKGIIEREGISERVIFTGMLEAEDRLGALRDSDIFALLSHSENFGMAVAEALACAVPVVISNRVGIYPQVNDFRAGLITNCGVNEAVSALEKLIREEDLRKEMSQNALRLVGQEFNAAKIVPKLLALYKQILP